MRIQFWGTRGSIPKPGPTTVRYGGNTSCVELVSDAGTRIVFDCGTGAHALGAALLANGGGAPIRGTILIGHTHWDHIQGLPFFAPLFVPGNEWDIYAPHGLGDELRETLAGQMQYTYFPVALEELGATIRYHELGEGSFPVGEVRVTTQYLNHPALTLGYRIEVGGLVVVYATDHEPHAKPLPASAAALPGAAQLEELHAEDRRHIAFLEGADLLIHDAQYTREEYPAKVGYGHSTIDYVVGVAREAHVKRLALFHHDPFRTDDALDAIVASLRARHTDLEVFGAAEGKAVELVEHASSSSPSTTPHDARSIPERTAPGLVWAAGDALELAERALVSIGYHLVAMDPSQHELPSGGPCPDVVLLDRRGTGWDALELARRVRATETGALGTVPIVVIASPEDAADMARGFDAGVTDWCTRPCSVPYLRSRLRAWLSRLPPRWQAACAPITERARLAAMSRLGLERTERQEQFDRLVRLAARALDVPYAAIKIIDSDREWTKAVYGGPALEQPRDTSICAHAILDDDVLVVSDSDARYGDNPIFQSEHRVRFYAGLPIKTPEGHAVGTLCVLDRVPRRLGPEELRTLHDVARLAEAEFAVAP